MINWFFAALFVCLGAWLTILTFRIRELEEDLDTLSRDCSNIVQFVTERTLELRNEMRDIRHGIPGTRRGPNAE